MENLQQKGFVQNVVQACTGQARLNDTTKTLIAVEKYTQHLQRYCGLKNNEVNLINLKRLKEIKYLKRLSRK